MKLGRGSNGFLVRAGWRWLQEELQLPIPMSVSVTDAVTLGPLKSIICLGMSRY